MKNNLKAFLEHFLLFSQASQAGFRLAVAVTFSVFIALTLHLGMPFWAAISVIAVMQTYLGNTVEKAIMRVFGTFLGATVGLLLGTLVATHFLYFTLSCFLAVFVGYYFSTQSKYPYAYVLGALTCFLILGEILINPSFSFSMAVWRTSEVLIGVIGTVITSFLIFPNTAETKIESLLKKITATQTELFELCLAFNGENSEFTPRSLSVKKDLCACLSLVSSLEKEYNVDFKLISHYKNILSFLQRQNRILHDLFIASTKLIDHKLLEDEKLNTPIFFANLRSQIHNTNVELINPNSKLKLFTDYHTFEQQFIQLRNQHYFLKYNVNEVLYFIYFIEQLSRLISSFEERIENRLNFSRLSLASKSRAWWSAFEFRNALSSGVGAVIALLIWITSNLPGGIQGIISSYVVSMQKNITDKKTMALQRILGGVIGGTIGLLSIAFIQFNITSMLCYLFFLTWFFGYITFSGKSYAYIGIQANIALAVSFVQTNGLHNISPAIERIAGIFIGIFSIFIASYLINPISAEALFKKNINNVSGLLNQIIKRGFLTLSLEELRESFFKIVERSNKNLSLLNSVLINKNDLEKTFYESASETFERIGSILLQIKHKTNLDKIEILAQSYQLNINNDLERFSQAMVWLSMPLKKNITDLSATLKYFKENIQVIRDQNLNTKRGILQSKDLVYLYHYLTVILEVSIEYDKRLNEIQTNESHSKKHLIVT